MGNAVKIILDTDIGNDVDDALALTYLLKQPKCELLGIITSCGDAQLHAQLTSAVCYAATGRNDIPIYPGTNNCIIVPQREQYVPHAVVLDHWRHETSFRDNYAIDFVRQAVRDNPGEVVFLEIAPPSNLARALLADSELAALLKGVVLMGGRFGPTTARSWTQRDPAKRRQFSAFEPGDHDEILLGGDLEPNACMDPFATAITYQAPIRMHRSVGVDATRQVTMNREAFQTALSGKGEEIHRLLFEMGNIFINEIGIVTFHDPLPTVTLFREDVCAFTRGRASVELKSEHLRGFTYFEQDDAGPHEVASSVNPAAFFDEFLSVI